MRNEHTTTTSVLFFGTLLIISAAVVPEPDVFNCFTFFPNRFLEKSGSVFLAKLKNASECIERCLSAREKHGILCKSAMWKRDTEDCILSKYDRNERFDFYQIAPNLEIDLYENRCQNNETMDLVEELNMVDAVAEASHDEKRTTIRIRDDDVTPVPKIRKQRFQPDASNANTKSTEQVVPAADNEFKLIPPSNNHTRRLLAKTFSNPVTPAQPGPKPLHRTPTAKPMHRVLQWTHPITPPKLGEQADSASQQVVKQETQPNYRTLEQQRPPQRDRQQEASEIYKSLESQFESTNNAQAALKQQQQRSQQHSGKELATHSGLLQQLPQAIQPVNFQQQTQQIPQQEPMLLPQRAQQQMNLQMQQQPLNPQMQQQPLSPQMQHQQMNRQMQQQPLSPQLQQQQLNPQMQQQQTNLQMQQQQMNPQMQQQQTPLNGARQEFQPNWTPHNSGQQAWQQQQQQFASQQHLNMQQQQNQQFGRFNQQNGSPFGLSTQQQQFPNQQPWLPQNLPSQQLQFASQQQQQQQQQQQLLQQQQLQHQQPNWNQQQQMMNQQQQSAHVPAEGAAHGQPHTWQQARTFVLHATNQPQQQQSTRSIEAATPPPTTDRSKELQESNEVPQSTVVRNLRVVKEEPIRGNNIRGSILFSADRRLDRIVVERDVSMQDDQSAWATPYQWAQNVPALGTVTPRAPIRRGPVTTHYYRPPTSPSSTYATTTTPPTALVAVTPIMRQNSVPPPTPTRSFLPSRTHRELTNDEPCFIRVRRRQLVNFEERAVRGISARDCLASCQYSTLFYCASVNYDSQTRTCYLNGGSAHLNKENLRESNMDYFENTCNPTIVKEKGEGELLEITTLTRCFAPTQNTMLVELDSSVVGEMNSLAECQTECALSKNKRGTVCVGLNWIAVSRGCMLYKPGYDRRLMSYAQHSTYYENKCSAETFGKTTLSRDNDYYDDAGFAQS